MKMKRAVFIDRDGTLNEMVYDPVHGIMDSPRRPEQIVPMKGAGEFLKRLREAGYYLVVVTNQPGLAKGTLTEAELDAVNKTLAEQLAREGGHWDDLRYCPHHPEPGRGGVARYTGACHCRKPMPGLIQDAARDHGLDVAQSWMIGDGLVDVQAGRAAGCRTVLFTKLKISHVEQFFDMDGAQPDAVAGSLSEALGIMLEGKATRRRKE
jgi:D-glycero-D-manno-heptose 1,7-bisphosphate phosphatase